MTTPAPNQKGQIVRVMTYGKEEDAVDQAILIAIEGGYRVLVKVFPHDDIPADDSAGASAVAAWAEALSKTLGTAWERVGGDVLFRRPFIRPTPSVT